MRIRMGERNHDNRSLVEQVMQDLLFRTLTIHDIEKMH